MIGRPEPHMMRVVPGSGLKVSKLFSASMEVRRIPQRAAAIDGTEILVHHWTTLLAKLYVVLTEFELRPLEPSVCTVM